MEIKCNLNSYYFNHYIPQKKEAPVFNGQLRLPVNRVEECADKFVKRPVAEKNATGLFGLIKGINNYKKNYIKNIRHTYDHKVIFALVEKEIFGNHSIDSVTHDADKMLLYLLGFPKSFVSNFHRKHSVHHTESGKSPNLRSMLCDNIASSPEFKPEKKFSLRDHFNRSQELQSVSGFKNMLEKYSYGENLNFTLIKSKQQKEATGFKGVMFSLLKALMIVV